MSRMNVDEKAMEPIQVTLDGRDFTVVKLTTAVMQSVQELAKDPQMDTPIKQLGILFGVDPSQLVDIDLIRAGVALDFITKEIHKAMDSGNPSGAAAR